MKFIVTTREVWTQGVAIEADTSLAAINLVATGEGEPIDSLFEYSHTLDPAAWTVEPSG